jgi:hypothetical protein
MRVLLGVVSGRKVRAFGVAITSSILFKQKEIQICARCGNRFADLLGFTASAISGACGVIAKVK